MKISNAEQTHTLELKNSDLEDSGTYTATAKNEHGYISCHCDLIVDKGIRAYIAPEFLTTFPETHRVAEKDVLRLSAQIEAYPAVGKLDPYSILHIVMFSLYLTVIAHTEYFFFYELLYFLSTCEGVTWYHNGLRLRPNRKTSVTLDNNGFVELTILDVSLSHCGTYTCKASNVVGHAECSCKVDVDACTIPSNNVCIPIVAEPNLP